MAVQRLLWEAADGVAWKALPSWVQARVLGEFETRRYPTPPCAMCVLRTGTPGPPETVEHMVGGCASARHLVASAVESLEAIGEAPPPPEQVGALVSFLTNGAAPSAASAAIRVRLMGALAEEARRARRQLGARDLSYAEWAEVDQEVAAALDAMRIEAGPSAAPP